MASPKKRQADARAFLLKHYKEALVEPATDRIASIKETVWTPARQDQKIQLIAIAYAMLILFRDDQVMLQGLAKRGSGRAAKPDAARVYVEAIYFDTLSTSREKSKVLSRWTTVVRYLDHKQFKPSNVEELAAQPGQGIDAWSKAYAKSRRPAQGAVAQTKSATVTIKIQGLPTKQWDLTDAAVLQAFIAKLETIGAPVKPKSKLGSIRPLRATVLP